MATTAIFPLHIGKGRSVAMALKDSIDYLADPDKTDNGEWVSSYECDPRVADAEFLLAKQQYFSLTGKNQGKKDVIAYHVRQSFTPGEITPEEANRIGYELAMRFTKGRYAFLVCTHTDQAHIHSHIVWNSTALDCKGKFRNFIGSAFALRRLSDIICAENGLTVIKNPKPSRGKNYAQHMYGSSKPAPFSHQIRQSIDNALSQAPKTFEDFIALIEASGVTTSRRGKHMRFMMPGQKQPTKLATLRGDYTEEAIRERIDGRRIVSGSSKNILASVHETKSNKPGLVIDIQAKMREGKGEGYARWAERHNLKQMAKTLIFIQEHGLDDYNALKEKAMASMDRFNRLSENIRTLDEKLITNSELQKQIVTYSKTRATYIAYRKAGYSKAFKAANETDILLHQAAKKAFDALGLKRLPTVASLRAEYAPMLEEKKKTFKEYRQAKTEMKDLLMAADNVKTFLNLDGHISDQIKDRPQR